MEIPQKVNIEITLDPDVLLLGIHDGPLFIVVQFTAAKLWKPHMPVRRCTDKENVVCLYTMEYYSAVKKKESSHFQDSGWNWRPSY